MAAESPTSTTINPSPAQPVAPISKTKEKRKSRYVAIVPVVVLLLAGAMLFSITGNWNSWISSREIQETDDAYVRADLTPLSTRVSGTVAEVAVNDYQKVKVGDLLVHLKDEDYRAQVDQAAAVVRTAEAAIENIQRQELLQDARISQAQAMGDFRFLQSPMIMSQFIASSHPPPRACPLMAPTIGFAVRFNRSQSANWLRWMRSTGVASDSSLMSAPAENASSFPVRTVALIRSSLSNASRASTSSLRSSKFSALRTLGLFKRTIPMGGSVSTSIWLNGKPDQSGRLCSV